VCRYIALIEIVIVCTGNPKTTRNEQVCVHQKSQRK